jgi:hypothetical protein
MTWRKLIKHNFSANINFWGKGFSTVNYEKIANLVHECVKNPAKLLESKPQAAEAKSSEMSVIENVFSRYEVSGGVAAIEAGPLTMW